MTDGSAPAGILHSPAEEVEGVCRGLLQPQLPPHQSHNLLLIRFFYASNTNEGWGIQPYKNFLPKPFAGLSPGLGRFWSSRTQR